MYNFGFCIITGSMETLCTILSEPSAKVDMLRNVGKNLHVCKLSVFKRFVV